MGICASKQKGVGGGGKVAPARKDADQGSARTDSWTSSVRVSLQEKGEFAALQLKSAVKVVVVVRPLLSFEKAKSSSECVDVPSTTVVQLPPRRGTSSDPFRFDFDRVYKMNNPGRQMFAEVVQPLLCHFLQGFNTTVFAYGQTGSGKTFAMGTMGRQLSTSGESDGIISRSMRFVFDRIKDIRQQYDVSLKISFVEIHQDDVRDLLGDGENYAPIHVRESPERGTYLENAQEVLVHSMDETAHLLEAANLHRAVGAHNLNEHSSRSHAICTLQMEQRLRPGVSSAPSAPRFLRSKLHLVDLAGSERAKETGTTGQQFAEGVNINKGLLALGNVIGALTEGAGRKHIPYRDSKLTRILQDSLGGNSETLMVACVSPAATNYEPTLSTLRYAARARSIHNQVKQNNKITPEEEITYLRAELEEKTALVAKLQSQLDMAASMMRGSVSPDNIKLVLPGRSPHAAGLTSTRASFTGSGAF